MVLSKSFKGMFEHGFDSSCTARPGVDKLTPVKVSLQYIKWLQQFGFSWSNMATSQAPRVILSELVPTVLRKECKMLNLNVCELC